MTEDSARVTTKDFKDSNAWRQCHPGAFVVNERGSEHWDCAPFPGSARGTEEEGAQAAH
jgi:hypothetical protein